jgi:hypothetical protein
LSLIIKCEQHQHHALIQRLPLLRGKREPVPPCPLQQRIKIFLGTRSNNLCTRPGSNACCRQEHALAAISSVILSPLEDDTLGMIHVIGPSNTEPLPQKSTGILRKDALDSRSRTGTRRAANVPPYARRLKTGKR